MLGITSFIQKLIKGGAGIKAGGGGGWKFFENSF